VKIYGLNPEKASLAARTGDVTISVFGLGRMGLPLAALLAEAGPRVIGVDVDEEMVASINHGECPITGEPGLSELVEKGVGSGRLRATCDARQAASEADVLIVVVPSMANRGGHFDLSKLKSLYRIMGECLHPGDMVIQESTVPLRTSEDLLLPILLEYSGLIRGDFGLARCPEHARYGSVIEDIRGSHRKIVGGIDGFSADAASGIYSTINTRGVVTVQNTTTAEAAKLFAASYLDVNIALANELAKVCDEVGIDAVEVFGALSTPPAYVPMFMPGCGVGGHCIPVCGYGIRSAVEVETPLITLARETNDTMPEYVVGLVEGGLRREGMELKESNVLIMGLTYRGDVKDTLNSPAISIAMRLGSLCHQVYAYDPLLGDEVGQFGPKVLGDLGEVGRAAQIDAVVVASDNSMFVEMNWAEFGQRLRRKVVVDGRQCLDLGKLRNQGWTAFSVGRVR